MKRLLFMLSAVSALWAVSAEGRGSSDHASSSLQAIALESIDAFYMSSLGATPDSMPAKCGLPALSFALGHRRQMAPELQRHLFSILQRPVLEKSIVAGHFRIHYDTSASSIETPAMLNVNHQRIPGSANEFADSVAAVANYAWEFETGTLGFLAPPSDQSDGGGPEYDIYIQNIGNVYGYTTPEVQLSSNQEGQTYTTFITIHNDFTFVSPPSNRGLPALRVTVAHELHHAIQIGNYGYWPDDIYFYEMTSVWMEDVVYTDVNDYYQYLRSSQGHFARPEVPFTSNDPIIYSRTIWDHYLARKFGRDVVRSCWEQVRHARPLLAIDNALHNTPYLSNFKTAFAEWSLWNYFTGVRSDTLLYYPEGENYPLMTQNGISFTPPSRAVQGSSDNLASRYYQVVSPGDTLTLVASNLDIASALQGLSVLHPYAYLLNTSKPDESYKATPSGIYVKLDVTDPSNWWSWEIDKGSIGTSRITEGQPFPNPFRSDGHSFVSIPVAGTAAISGSLSIFSSSMDLIYSWSGLSTLQFDKQVFRWNGRTNDDLPAVSGIYMYVLDTESGTIKGKIALLRK